ncbi:peptidylprolyl isomerase [Sphingopyxis yananensis]|uniref:peptidylprolyl isomerase n=1 Tax=Sphingopyxis yananensis TaxID=2886687 RepID=UPI001D0F8FF6|nr:peptidylprolyl isomerase [Sphingopyxis yananensis]MCC2601786.1 peptidylprolyl isomerase [Sphingopyxis yananensis]
MKIPHRSLVVMAMAFGLALPAVAQDTPAPVPADAPAKAEKPVMDTSEFMGVPEYMLNLDLSTGGRVVIQLYPSIAPHHVERVKLLARNGFYNGVKFHRVIEGFMAQTGDPTATGQGGSDLPDLKAEFNEMPHLRGTLSMARAQSEDSANSQFFIMLQPRFSLDRRYTVFGRVVSGMQYVDAIQRGEPPAVMSKMVQVSVAADNLPPPAPALLVEDAAPTAPAAAISADELNAPIRR